MRLHKYSIAVVIAITALISTGTTLAQFGKNKVQYETFEWKYLRTRHFDVYYHEGGEYLARFAGIVSERSLASIERRLNYSINKRVPIMVYNSHNQFQQTNVINSALSEGTGGVTELFKNRVTLPFDGDYSQFRHVIHHELVHAVINDMFYGGTVQTAISQNVQVEMPLFMNEGLAEFEGVGGYDTQTDMFIRDMALGESLKGLRQLNGYLAYRGGQAFYWYIAEKYGDKKIGELLNRLKSVNTLDAAFRSSFNLTFDEFSEQWVKDLKKIYLPDIEKYEDVKDYATPHTNHSKDLSYYNTSPSLSPDGSKMAYISALGGEFGIYIKDITTKKSEPSLLVKSGRMLDFEELNILTPGISWNPDGKQIAISAKAGGEDALYIVDVASGDYEKKKFGLRSLTSAAWSPDGKNIVFLASEYEEVNLYLYNIADESVLRLTNDVFTELHPTWSPDSKTLYFVSDRGNNLSGSFGSNSLKMWDYNFNQRDIYSMDIETKKIQRITFDPDNDKTSLAVAPNGKSLLYVSDKSGIGNLYQYDFLEKKSHAKTNSLQGMAQLSLARDGSKLLFNTLVNGGYDIYEMRFPLEKKSYEKLTLTKYIERKNKQLQEQTAPAIVEDSVAIEPVIRYGNFEVDMSRQQVVAVNAELSKSVGSAAMVGSASAYIDTTISGPHNYKITFSPDIIYSTAGYNTFWGAQGVTQMLFSDMLGDHQIFVAANLFIDLANSNFYVAYSYLPQIVDYQIAVFNSPGFLQRSDGYFYRFRNTGFNLESSYPFSTFRRLEFSLSYYNMGRTNIDNPQIASVTRNAVVPRLNLVYDDTRPGWWGPSEGTRYIASVMGTPKIGNSVSFMKATGDFRQYFSLFDGYLTTAIRGTAGTSFGLNPQRFVVGGTDNWINRSFANNIIPFDEPEDLAFMEFGLPMRGWSIGERIGRNFFLGNVELRFPLFYGLMAGPLPILFQGFQGTMFMDVGSAWNDNFVSARPDASGNLKPRDLLMSAGIGVRSAVFNFPVRIDVAWRNEFFNWSQPVWMFSLGGDF